MQLKKLDNSFYQDNPHIKQALDYDMRSSSWNQDKIRGHGIVSVTINNLKFAIPVRSNVRHSASYILLKNKINPSIKGMGLDYSKALLIKNDSHVTDNNFNLNNKDAGKKLIGKTNHVTKQFESYLKKYIRAVNAKDQNILDSSEYRYTTLINYHNEIGLL